MDIVVVSALIGALVAGIGALVQSVLTTRAKIDESLRTDRIRVYKLLWEQTGLLPLWPPRNDVTYERLAKLTCDLRDWYFSEGGVFLSSEARRAYESLQKPLCGLVDENRERGNEVISGTDYAKIQSWCSSLRTELTNDLQSRKRTMLSQLISGMAGARKGVSHS